LIRRQDTHLDSLAERLREDRVKAIIEPMLAGLELGNIPNEDISDLAPFSINPRRRTSKDNFKAKFRNNISMKLDLLE
jgi:hypothetical protein